MAEEGGWVEGDATHLPIPAHMRALREGGTGFLTAAFHVGGVLAADNEVASITRLEECPGGSTGTKVFLSVTYAKPPGLRQGGLPEDLFVKFSRDFDNPIRDRGRDQLEAEVRFAGISRHPTFPIRVPQSLFGDYHRASGTGLLITERIAFGSGAIERHHEKCLDYELTDALAHYRCVLTANACLAGAHKSGRLGRGIDTVFPFDKASAIASDPIRYDARQLRNRIARIASFSSDFPRLLPASIAAPDFLARLAEEMPLFLERQRDIKHFLVSDPDLIALCHWNANIDNAWFWRDAGGLHCGLLDWGRVGQMSLALALWGTLSAAEPEMLDAHLDTLLTLFLRTYAARGGPEIRLARLHDHLFLTIATMGMAWLLDAPPIIRAQIPDLTPAHDRFDIRFKANEAARTQLHMLTNVLALWDTRHFGERLRRL
ncbi:hypothetical protein [Acidocella sp.]|uniref:hypothetical protein n=1 Tax=Acidocella sp. TaxID=50710 RepID=UPI00260D58D3|nr:hypothetical protein [Acidocella sp.]